MGVFLIACTKSSVMASASSLVFLPRMTSTSGIFSAGEKKWMPMNLSGRLLASARPVIGSVEVLEPKIDAGPDYGFDALRHIRLDVAVFEHRFDDVVHIGQRREVHGWAGCGRGALRHRPGVMRRFETAPSTSFLA